MYDIEVDTITIGELNEMADPYSEKLKDYEMVILGFDDLYEKVEDVSANAIVEYIGTGKALLFTHDTTSYWNRSTHFKTTDWYNPHWGYTFNQIVRDKVGLDRYGVTSTAFEDSNASNVKALLTSGIDNQILGDTVTDIQDGTYGTYGPDNPGPKYTVAFVPDKQVTDDEGVTHRKSAGATQGFTNSIIDKYAKGSSANTTKVTETVSQVNRGQITEYPYKLPEVFDIEQTHNQYYQLNMDADDVVVWYTLGGSEYADAKNDGTNAYYIYNRGNITYSGAGHIDNPNDRLEGYEAQLFLNTMIAAYRAGNGAPTINFTNADGITNASTLLVPMQQDDELTKNIVTGQYERKTYSLNGEQTVYFYVQDNNLTSDKTIRVELYYAAEDGTEDDDLKTDDENSVAPKVKPATLGKVYRADTGEEVSASNLTSGYAYKTTIKSDVLSNFATLSSNETKIYMKAITTIAGTEYVGFDELTLKKLGLLRLE